MQPKLVQHSKTVMVVGHDEDLLFLTRVFLDQFGYEVDVVDSGPEALARFDPAVHDVVLTDELAEPLSGTEMALIIKLRSPVTPIVMCTEQTPPDCPAIDVYIKEKMPFLAIKNALDRVTAGP